MITYEQSLLFETNFIVRVWVHALGASVTEKNLNLIDQTLVHVHIFLLVFETESYIFYFFY